MAVSQGWDGPIELRSAISRRLRKVLPKIDESDLVCSLVFAPDSQLLAAGYFGFRVRLSDVVTGRLVQLLRSHGDDNAYLAFSPDGTHLAVGGGYDKEVVLCNLRAHTLPVRVILTQAERGAPEEMADFLEVAHEQIPTQDVNLVGHTNNIRGVAYSPDGRTVATVAADGALKLWDPIDGRLRATLLPLPSRVAEDSPEWIAYTPEGYYDASVGGHGYVGWRVDGELLPTSAYASTRFDPERVVQALDGA